MRTVLACAVLAAAACGPLPSPETDGGTAATGSGGSGGRATGSGGRAAGSGGAVASDGSTAVGDADRQLCIDLINQYRATLGLAPYTRWTSAEGCADGQAQSDSQTGTAHGAFGDCGESAQDECPGWGGPPATAIKGCLQMMWSEGPGGGHYENMRSNRKLAACGFYVLANGKVWAVQDFQ